MESSKIAGILEYRYKIQNLLTRSGKWTENGKMKFKSDQFNVLCLVNRNQVSRNRKDDNGLITTYGKDFGFAYQI